MLRRVALDQRHAPRRSLTLASLDKTSRRNEAGWQRLHELCRERGNAERLAKVLEQSAIQEVDEAHAWANVSEEMHPGLKVNLPPAVMSVVPGWRSFRWLSPNEAAFLAERRLYSQPSTLEVTCMPGMTNFALTEQMQSGAWRWAICCSECVIRDEGWELALADAKKAAVETRPLWFHRCDAKGFCRCAGPTC